MRVSVDPDHILLICRFFFFFYGIVTDAFTVAEVEQPAYNTTQHTELMFSVGREGCVKLADDPRDKPIARKPRRRSSNTHHVSYAVVLTPKSVGAEVR